MSDTIILGTGEEIVPAAPGGGTGTGPREIVLDKVSVTAPQIKVIGV